MYNSRIETGIWVPALLVTKLRIFSLLLVMQRLFSGLLIGCGKKNFTGFSGTDLRKNRLISREVAEIFGVNFTDKQQLKISKSIKQLPNGSRSKETVNNKTKTQGESSSFLFLSKNGI